MPLANLIIENKDFLDGLEVLSCERINMKSLGISHEHSRMLYMSEPDDALSLVEAAHFPDSNRTKTENFHSA